MNTAGKIDHSWIVDVLTDLGTYAAENNLARLQEMVTETRRTANEEILALSPPPNYDEVMVYVFPFIERKNL